MVRIFNELLTRLAHDQQPSETALNDISATAAVREIDMFDSRASDAAYLDMATLLQRMDAVVDRR